MGTKKPQVSCVIEDLEMPGAETSIEASAAGSSSCCCCCCATAQCD